METGNIIAIVIALIGVASGLWAQFIQFKKDSGRIGDVKSDTSEIKPQVLEIRKDTEKVKDNVLEKIVPALDVMSDQSSSVMNGLTQLVEEMNFQKRLKSEVSGVIINPDYLLSGIQQLYASNAEINHELGQAMAKNNELMLENSRLRRQITIANEKLSQYEIIHEEEQER